jgi:hypothetical protein
MTLKTLIERLEFMREIHGNNIKVTLDDLYTTASLDIEDIYPEEKGDKVVAPELVETVLVIRA